MQTCSLVPPSTPDTAFYSGSVYYPLGKPEDPTFYWLNRMRQEQSAAQRADFLINLYDANGKVASSTYRIYHDAVLNSEKQAGRMFTSLIGIEERVSPNEIDEDSIYSIYHRTVEWTRKKELGVIVYNSYPISVKEIIKLYVATPDLCIYNYAKMIQRQQLTQIKDKLWELVLPTRLKANSYATFIIHYCEGQEKEGDPVVHCHNILFELFAQCPSNQGHKGLEAAKVKPCDQGPLPVDGFHGQSFAD